MTTLVLGEPPGIETTHALVYPDGVGRGLEIPFIMAIESKGYDIVGQKTMMLTAHSAAKFLLCTKPGEHQEMGMKVLKRYAKTGQDPIKDFGSCDARMIGMILYQRNLRYLMLGPVIGLIVRGPGAIQGVRELVEKPKGSTTPSLRDRYSKDSFDKANAEKRGLHKTFHAAKEELTEAVPAIRWQTEQPATPSRNQRLRMKLMYQIKRVEPVADTTILSYA